MTVDHEVDLAADFDGKFGPFGGRYVPESLMAALSELEDVFNDATRDPVFMATYREILRSYGGRPSPITKCHNLSRELGVELYFKREDLNHTGSHKINNVIGQALLTQRMGKSRMIAETGAGQHGVATATAAALLGLKCTVYMGEVDTERQALNVFRMKLLGAEVIAVKSGSRTLKDAINEAMREWVACVEDTHYCIGSAMGPHPYPYMVRQFQRIIGDEAKQQLLDEYQLSPNYVIACVGGGSNAIGTFTAFVDTDSKIIGVEPEGGAAIGRGVLGVIHGMRSQFIQDEFGQLEEAHSISAGLDYPGVGPEHAHLAQSGRANYATVNDQEVLDAFQRCSRSEGIIPALEPAHALAYLFREAGREIPLGSSILLTMSGRGDKDSEQVAKILGYLK